MNPDRSETSAGLHDAKRCGLRTGAHGKAGKNRLTVGGRDRHGIENANKTATEQQRQKPMRYVTTNAISSESEQSRKHAENVQVCALKKRHLSVQVDKETTVELRHVIQGGLEPADREAGASAGIII
jgi:hypothetical protein